MKLHLCLDEYFAALRETVEVLETMEEKLSNSMFLLAVTNVWKEWSDQQPIGREITITADMFANTGDSRIDELFKLYVATVDCLEIIQQDKLLTSMESESWFIESIEKKEE
jgi:hypothetical protein